MRATDYSAHKLTDESQLKTYYQNILETKSGKISFWQYAENLYRKIAMMVPGETIKVDDLVDEKNRDLFIKLICGFMISGVAQGFYFNKTYTELRRASAPITQSIENILKPQKI